MKTTPPSLVLLIALLGAPLGASAAHPAECAGGVAPPDAAAISGHVARYWRHVTQAVRLYGGLGRSASVDGYCVTRHGVFYSPEWLPDAELQGPPASAPGYAALAYLLGVRLHSVGKAPAGMVEPRRRGADDAPRRPLPAAGAAMRVGFFMAGCALARAAVTGDRLALQFRDLRARVGVGAELGAARTAFMRGHGACRAR